MYFQIGKPKKTINPVLLTASGIFVGAAASMLVDEKNRRILGDKIRTSTKYAQKKASQIQEKITDITKTQEGEAEENQKTKLKRSTFVS